MDTDLKTEGRSEERRPGVIDVLASYPHSSVTSVARPEYVEGSSVALPLPLPHVPITVRAATLDDLPFMDRLQKLHSRAVGWMPTKSLEGKIAAGHVLVAEATVDSSELMVDRNAQKRVSLSTTNDQRSTPLGYLIGADRYFKRDDVGIIYQMNVVPGRQRGLIGATLLKAQFERSAYGCRLYCCWCAQDLAANKFWEAMGFTALAFRTGSPTRGTKGAPRMHIFWQKRIRAGDTGDVSRGGTPWWFPSQTTGGSIREDRIVLPIPPGMRWSDAKPIVLPGTKPDGASDSPKQLSGRTRAAAKVAVVEPLKKSRIIGGGLRFGSAVPFAAEAEAKPKRQPRANTQRVKQKNDPKLVAAARELRDRWLEEVNAAPQQAITGKYDVSRAGEAQLGFARRGTMLVEQGPLALPASIAA